MPLLATALGLSLLGSFGGLLVASSLLLFTDHVRTRLVPWLVSYAVGALLGVALLALLPEALETMAPAQTFATLLVGILLFFVLEKLVLLRHCHTDECHVHATAAPLVLIGDSFHNFTDGVIIASAFIADVRLGVVTAIAIIAHEIPQEIGDFLVLLHSGFSRAKALAANALSGLATVVGALIAYFALASVTRWIPEILAIAAASMIYVAVADLIPGLHKRTAIRETLVQVAFIALGIASIWVIHAALLPDH